MNDEQDNRAYKISLTEIGKKKVQESMNAVDMYDTEFFSILPTQDRETLQSSFLKLLGQVKSPKAE
jgi:DNA-binding MarR family transcriptional regulator